MSFGRWLLIHSFSIFLVTIVIFGYIYRKELQLEQVYNQLLNIDSKSTTIESVPGRRPAEKELQDGTAISSKSTVAGSRSSVTMSLPPQQNVKPVKTTTAAVTVESTPPVAELDNSPGLQEEIFLARQAYWDKNYTAAISRYQKLIQQDRNNPDYRGELGNIYYALNDYANASKLYYQSALIFIQQNRPEQARMLVSPIIAMNRELGEELKSKLRDN